MGEVAPDDTATHLEKHVRTLAEAIGPRHTQRPKALEEAARYIEAQLQATGLATRRENVSLPEGGSVSNIVTEIAGVKHPNEIVVIGAHYDSVAPSCPGANDNASGVAALLVLAAQLGGQQHNRTLRLVAFVNEEPPYFQTESMGSVVHAKGARAADQKIVAMLSLETIGYYSNEPDSQRFPISVLERLYPDTGNFIGFVSNIRSAVLLRRIIKRFRTHSSFPVEGIVAPEGIPGIGWSDHQSFWQQGYPAIMVTDTAPFRYPYYHLDSDTWDKLDYTSTAQVVWGLKKVIEDLLE